MNVDFLQHVKRSLSGVNQGVLIGSITATIIFNADTYAGLYSAVANATGLDIEEDQVNKIKVLPALVAGNVLGILTDAAILNLTTVAGLRQLFTAQDGTLSEAYTGDSLN